MTATTGIGQLAVEYDLAPPAAAALERLVDLIEADDLAPTTVRDRDRIVQDHIADSLSGLKLDSLREATTLADLGSGAGMPGIPLALALPDTEVRLVETNGRKADFLERAVAAVGSPANLSVVRARAEEWSDGIDANDVITARALGPLPVVLEYAAPLLALGGSLVVWRGRRDPEAEAEAEGTAEVLGLQGQPPTRVVPYAGAEHRYLHLFSKVRQTPAGYPRRAGRALKRPLGRQAASDRDRR